MFCNLSAEIKKRGLSQKDFAKEVRISANLFSKKINSRVLFNYEEIKRIAGYFHPRLSVDYLFEESC